MLFTELTFWAFFAIVGALYVMLPHKAQNRMLLVASYVFYGAWDWRFLSLILLSTVVDYVVGLRLGQEVSDTVEPEDARPHLLLAGSEADADHVRAAVGDTVAITATASLFEAESLMNRRIFDCIVMAATGAADAALDLCVQIRRNPRLFNLPVVLMIDGERTIGPRALSSGASQVLSRVPDVQELRWAVGTLVRRQKGRWAIRRALDRTRVPALLSRDLPDLYTAAMLTAAPMQSTVSTAPRFSPSV